MQINLSDEIANHFERLRSLAEEAGKDSEESFSSRASAMSALTGIIKELTKEQEKVANMDMILKTEQALIEAAREIFAPEDYHIFTNKLQELLG